MNKNNNMSTSHDFSVMVVDDQRSMRKIIRSMLKQIGVNHIIEAEDGVQALKELSDTEQARPDLIMSDMHMVPMDGVELCNRLRLSKDEGNRQIPFVLLTGETDRMLIETCEQVGACAVLHKPVSSEILKNALVRAVGYDFAPAG